MADVFAITTAAEDNIKINENGPTVITFTATNKTDKPIRGVAKIKPLDNTQSEWLKIEGETERDFPSNGTQQYTVNFNKPASEETEETQSFPFRLDVISSANPDEDFTEGPTVNIETPEKKDDKKKPFPIWIPIVAGVLLFVLIGSVVGYLLMRDSERKPVAENVIVPDLYRKNIKDAEKELTSLGLKTIKYHRKLKDIESDIVIEQEPPKDTEVEANSTVTLMISTKRGLGRVRVPKVSGLTLNKAKAKLESKGLKVEQVFISSPTNATDVVLSQTPDSNQEVESGTIIKLTFPKKRVRVPNLSNMTFEDAKTDLNALGLTVTRQDNIQNGKTVGTVYDQDPRRNARLESGSNVKLYVVKKPPDDTYKVSIDCKHKNFNNTETSNTITVTIHDSSNRLIQSQGKNGISTCNSLTSFNFTTDKPVKYVYFKTNGNEKFFIDKWMLYKNNRLIKTKGDENRKGWCLSTDRRHRFNNLFVGRIMCVRELKFSL